MAKNFRSFDLLADLLQFDLLAHFLFHITFRKLDRFLSQLVPFCTATFKLLKPHLGIFASKTVQHENETKLFFKMALVCTSNEDIVLAVNPHGLDTEGEKNKCNQVK